MCMVEYCDDMVTVIDDGRFVMARKQHKCTECNREIATGESYHTEAYRFDGGVRRHKTCAHCMVARAWLQDECGGWVYGGIEEDMAEHASEHYGLPVARLYVALRNDWRRRDGSLRPVPAMPKTTHDLIKEASVGPPLPNAMAAKAAMQRTMEALRADNRLRGLE